MGENENRAPLLRLAGEEEVPTTTPAELRGTTGVDADTLVAHCNGCFEQFLEDYSKVRLLMVEEAHRAAAIVRLKEKNGERLVQVENELRQARFETGQVDMVRVARLGCHSACLLWCF